MPKSLALMLCAIAFCIPNAIIHGQSATQSTAQEPTQSAGKEWMRDTTTTTTTTSTVPYEVDY